MSNPTRTDLYLSKDFIETAEGLCFAVVQSGTESDNDDEKVLCFLRYIKRDAGQNTTWHKVSTDQANEFLSRHYPQYLYHSAVLDAHVHAVSIDKISHHHKCRERLQEILANRPHDKVEEDVKELCRLFHKNGVDMAEAGITGSVLINAQQQKSDIDLVFYDRDVFHKARSVTAMLIENKQLGALAEQDWQEAYARRSCTLDLEQYVWHERRKFNKALINGRKFDLNFVAAQGIDEKLSYRKLGAITVQCKITDDWHGFDYPALYAIDHAEIKSVVCFIATYTGQAVTGETVEIAGLLEQSEQGDKRIVVGSSREAPGEYIKVIDA